MNKSRFILLLMLTCVVAIGVLGCADESTPTSSTETTAPPGSTTITNAPTTTAAVTSTTTAAPTLWTKYDLSPEPSARMYHAMACDTSSGKVFLFGGSSGEALSGHDYADLWAYDPAKGKWSELHPVGAAPSARYGHGMVYDPSTGKIFLFGGKSGITSYLADLWAYDPASNTWAELHPTGDTPDARAWITLAYDSQNGKIFMFGGTGGRLVPWDEFETNEGFDDLWSYDPVLNAWRELEPSGPGPSARRQYAMAYHQSTDKIILFGGFREPSHEPMPLNDLWSYDTATDAWTELHASNSPVGRGGAVMVYDPGCALAVLFGGDTMDPDLWLSEVLWAYDSAANAWQKLEPADRFPYGRQGHAMVYDPKIGGIVMFGGLGEPQGYLSGTWTLTP